MKINKDQSIKQFKAYFIDLDGTSRDDAFLHSTPGYFYGISKKNFDAIVKQNEKTPVIISTGRDASYVRKMLTKLKLQYAICHNGAQIINGEGEVQREFFINKSLGYSLIQFAHKKGLAVRVNDDDVVYGGGFRVWAMAKIFKEKHNRKNLDTFHDQYTKISLFGRRKKTMDKIIKEIKTFNHPISIVTSARGYGIEITNENATKGKGALWVCEQLNIDPKDAVHIGDTMNDTPGFNDLGAGIVMDNATKEVKYYAKYITTHYKKNGLINVFAGNIKVNPLYKKDK